ncbi:hypothetical protein NL676_021724 [Syzygium grande]|nr:hypothetical protein NL676_021724 [Syzygium grande]
MESNPDSEVEYEIVEDDEEHEELGGLAFKPEVVDPVPEQAVAEVPEPMDIDEDEEQDPELEIESETMSTEEEPEQSESSSESLGSDPDWAAPTPTPMPMPTPKSNALTSVSDASVEPGPPLPTSDVVASHERGPVMIPR